ncbi:MAG: hypothetical protein J6X55_17730 [Victivallales bacterium]|nr:hypothetical protein [Victivallales bacterium]
MTENENAFIVTVDGVDYALNKKPIPHWGKGYVLTVGDPADKNTYGPLVGIDDEGQNLCNSSMGNTSFSILENTPDSIRIRMVFPLSKVDRPKEISKSAEQIFYFTFASGMPGVIAESRIRCLTDKIRIHLYSCSVSCNFDCYYDKNGNRTEYGKGNWQNVGFKEVTAEKASGKYFFYPTIGRLPGRGLTTHVCSQWREKTLELGETVSMKIAFGKVQSVADGERLVAFHSAVNNPPEKPMEAIVDAGMGEMSATPTKKPIIIGNFDGWEGIPLTVERNKANDYRPAEANTWKGPHDLSFKAWAAFDKDNFYLRINVRDDQVEQTEIGTGIWAGDCIQIGIDPLCEKSLSPNQILLGVCPIPSLTVCGWSHPNRDYLRGDLLDVVQCAGRVDKGGYECEMAIPWSFLAPFELVRGKFGFNIVVLDGANRWMGITDGIAGGKVPGLYKDLHFRGMEDSLFAGQKTPKPELLFPSNIMPMDQKVKLSAYVYVNDQDLPADICIDFPGGGHIQKPLARGFNSFPCTFLPSELKRGQGKASVYLLSNGKQLYKHEYDVTMTDKTLILEKANELEAKAAKLETAISDIQTKTGKFPAYLSSREWIAKYYASRARMLAGYDEKASNAPAKEKLYYATLSRNFRNLIYCDAMVDDGLREAAEMLAGKRMVLEVPVPPKGIRPLPTNDGGFAIGDQEYYFLGGNTWGLANEDYLDYIAGSGMNFFNMFNLGNKPEPWFKMTKHAEDLGLFFNRRTCMMAYGKGNYYCVEELTKAPFVSIENQAPSSYTGTGTPWEPSPNLLYVIGSEEGTPVPVMTGDPKFTKEQLTERYAQQFTEYLGKKFGTVEELNRRAGSSFASFEDAAKFGKGLNCSPLKYEHYLCFAPQLAEAEKICTDNLRRLWKRPVSTHYSGLNFNTYDTLAGMGNYEHHWASFDLPGFDSGTGSEHKEFAMNFGGTGLLLVDLSRSLYPERTCVNNEEYLLSCSNPNATPPDIYHYTSALHPALHGRIASSIFVFDNTFTSRWGELTFRRAEGFYHTARATLDMRRLANQIAPFRNLNGPAAILYTMPGYLDKKYATRIQIAWEGMTFSGLPVKFISDKMLKDGKLANYKILAVNAKHVDDATFDTVISFAANGGTLLCQGEDALMFNDYGVKVPERAEKLNTHATRVAADFAHAWFDAYESSLAKHGLAPDVQIVGPDGKHVYGIEYRCAKDRDGKRLLYLVNFSKTQQLAKIAGDSTWFDLISMQPKSSTMTLQPLEVLLLKAQ